jgi:hypothetical protein
MTMPRAIALLVASIAVFAGGIALLAVRADAGFFSADAPRLSTGARTGDRAATPAGSGSAGVQEARATLTAAAGTLTATAPGAATSRPGGATPVPGPGTAVAIGQSITLGDSTYTVLEVIDPEPPGFFVTNPGMRRVAVLVQQQATGGTARYSFGLFRIRDSAGDEHSWAITNSEPNFGSGQLARGEMRTGWVSFQIPEGRQPSMLLLNNGRGFVEIARLD